MYQASLLHLWSRVIMLVYILIIVVYSKSMLNCLSMLMCAVSHYFFFPIFYLIVFCEYTSLLELL